MAKPGFDSELNGFGKRERKLSVKRHANGSLEIRRGDSMMSGMFQLADHVPAHLAHFFEELEHVRAETVSQAP
jgi:hypothetical protein